MGVLKQRYFDLGYFVNVDSFNFLFFKVFLTDNGEKRIFRTVSSSSKTCGG